MSTQKLTFITSFTVSLPLLCFAITEKMEVVESRENTDGATWRLLHMSR